MLTIADLVWIDSTGYHYADFPTFLQWVQQQYQRVYGTDIYLGPDSQDGQWTSILAQAFYDTAALGAQTYASFSPATAQGTGLSRVVKINGLTRLVPSNSTVQLTIGGTVGTVLNGAIAIDVLQQQWSIPNGTTIGSGGTVIVTATALVAGAIMALPDTIVGIFTPTNGWQTVNNALAATVGAPVETDAALRIRQAASTSLPAETVFDATLAGVANVTGVQEVVGYENPTNMTGPSTGYESIPGDQPPHSISIVVVGGDENAIASAIQVYKTPGTQTWGEGAGLTSIVVPDSKSMPVTINFMYGLQDKIGAQVTVSPGVGWVSSTESLIQAAVAAAIAAYPIGGDILTNQLYQAAYLYGTPQQGTYTVSSIELGICTSGTATFSGNPSNSDTLVIAGTSIEFVTGTPTGDEVQISGTDVETVAALLAFLNASTDANLVTCSYSLDSTGLILTVTAQVPGSAGDAITLTKSCSVLTLSGSTLSGGAYATTPIPLDFNAYPICIPSYVVIVT